MESIDTHEWIITNSLGGYSSGTVCGANTRTYHGYLIASLNPPTDRVVLLSKVEERILVENNYIDLSTNYYPNNTIHPQGYQYIESFKYNNSYPLWTYKSKDFELQKQIQMLEGSNSVIILYKNLSKNVLRFEVHPLWSYSIHHNCFTEDPKYNFWTECETDSFVMYPYYHSLPIFTRWNNAEFITSPCWYKNVQLLKEKERGLPYNSDYFRNGYFVVELDTECTFQFLVSTSKDVVRDFDFTNTIIYPNSSTSFFDDLKKSASKMVVERCSTSSKSIIAGYHWFTDWGRDTMISMRGITIATGNKEVSKSILSTFLSSVKYGLLPNRFPDNSNDFIQYNTLDASLWLFVTIYEYYLKFIDKDFINKHLDTLGKIIDTYIKGSIYNIKVTEEGFIYAGEQGVQLTWMDAIVDGKVITPRIGCPIEINVLWYNALRIFQYFTNELGISISDKYKFLISKIEKNFPLYFINDRGTLYDVIIPNVSVDASIRPNQLYAVSLPFSIINEDIQKNIFLEVKEHLYTFYGLRSLSPKDNDYKGFYGNGIENRDKAYHQGTVWPFLLEPYFISYFKLYDVTEESKRYVINKLQPMIDHFYNDAGINCISEVFDGDNPKYGKGCIQQAWSLGAILKLYIDFELYK